MRNRNRVASLVAAALIAVALTACGDAKKGPDTTSASDAFPVTVHGSKGDVTLPSAPRAIISLSPTATESLFAIGAGRQVVAVDDQSNYPTQAPKSSLSGFTPNAEAVAKYRPDLVVIQNDANGLIDALGKLKIPTLVQSPASTLDDVYNQINTLGTATGNGPSARQVTDKMRSDITDIVKTNKANTSLRYYHEVDNTYYSVTSSTFAGQIYGLFGLQNIADAADKTHSGYPQLSSEYIVTQSPDLIFLADSKCCGQNQDTVAQRPGWSNINAVKNKAVIGLDDDIASRWGPRTVELVRTVGNAVSRLPNS